MLNVLYKCPDTYRYLDIFIWKVTNNALGLHSHLTLHILIFIK